MTLPDVPHLVGASLIECSIRSSLDVAELRVGPLSNDTQRQLNAPHLRLRLHGLTQLELPCGSSRDARVRIMHGPTRTQNRAWHLNLELSDGRSFKAEYASSVIQGVYPGQVGLNSTDLHSDFQQVLRTTIDALVVNDLRSIRLLSSAGSHEHILHEVDEYPTTLVHPPPSAYEEMSVLPIGTRRDVWSLEMPLWSPDGRNDLSILMEVRRVGDELIGYLDSIHVL